MCILFATSDWMLNLPRPITTKQWRYYVQFGNNKRASRDKSADKYFSRCGVSLSWPWKKKRSCMNNRVREAVNSNNSSVVRRDSRLKSVTCARSHTAIQSVCWPVRKILIRDQVDAFRCAYVHLYTCECVCVCARFTSITIHVVNVASRTAIKNDVRTMRFVDENCFLLITVSTSFGSSTIPSCPLTKRV